MTASTHSTSRRAFLQRASALSVAGTATPLALSLAAIGEAAAQAASPADDYKALVCVFLQGGNDYANTLVPYDSASHAVYRSMRGNIALPRDEALAATLLKPTVALPEGRQFAFAPGLAPLLPLFDAGRLVVLQNVGTLIEPVSKVQYSQGRGKVRLPPKLFSHNDQQSFWQASAAEGATVGWGGRLGDLFAAGNGRATFSGVSVAGNAVFLSGRTAVQYQVTPTGSVTVNGIKAPLFGSVACQELLKELMTTSTGANVFETEYARIGRRAIEANDTLNAALAQAAPLATAFPAGNPLANQLRMVARMISARRPLGARRQVFFVSLGGFDTHDSLARNHPVLMAQLGTALATFYRATQELGLADRITTFTASDFGRSLVSNNGGSDHGWGGVQWVLGDAVQGRAYVGRAPVLANDGPDDVGQGRLLPTLAVDQMTATLARWFGVPAGDLPLMLPNLANHAQQDLGFLSPGA